MGAKAVTPVLRCVGWVQMARRLDMDNKLAVFLILAPEVMLVSISMAFLYLRHLAPLLVSEKVILDLCLMISSLRRHGQACAMTRIWFQ